MTVIKLPPNNDYCEASGGLPVDRLVPASLFVREKPGTAALSPANAFPGLRRAVATPHN